MSGILGFNHGFEAGRASRDAEVEALRADALRYRTVMGMTAENFLRLYSTRFDLREKFIDAEIDAARKEK